MKQARESLPTWCDQQQAQPLANLKASFVLFFLSFFTFGCPESLAIGKSAFPFKYKV